MTDIIRGGFVYRAEVDAFLAYAGPTDASTPMLGEPQEYLRAISLRGGQKDDTASRGSLWERLADLWDVVLRGDQSAHAQRSLRAAPEALAGHLVLLRGERAVIVSASTPDELEEVTREVLDVAHRGGGTAQVARYRQKQFVQAAGPGVGPYRLSITVGSQ